MGFLDALNDLSGGSDTSTAPAAPAPTSSAPSKFNDAFSDLQSVSPGLVSPLRITVGTPIAQGQVPVKPSAAEDFVNSIPSGAIQFSANAARGEQIESEERAMAFGQPNAGPPIPTGNAAAQLVGLPVPQGTAGQFGQSLGEFMGNPASYIGPGGPVRKGLGIVLGGLGAQAGEQTGLPGGQLLGGVAGGAISGLRAGGRSPIAPENAIVPGTADLFRVAKAGYKTLSDDPIFQPETMEQLVSDITGTMEDAGSRDYLAPKTFRAIQELKEENSVQGLQKVRQLLGGIGQRGDKDEGYASGMAKNAIDDFLQKNAPEQAAVLDKANQNFAAASRSQKLDTALDVAGFRTGRAGYGGNKINPVRQVLSPIVEKAIKGKTQGYSPDEIEAMREIVEGTPLTNFLRLGSMFAPEKGALNLGVGVEIGSKVLGVKGLPVLAVLGKAANKIGERMTEAQINRLSELVRKRSPAYADAVKAAGDKYSDAMDAFSASPTQPNFIKFVVASRALAAGFNRDGINISSGDLLRQFRSPAPAGAEEQDQNSKQPTQ